MSSKLLKKISFLNTNQSFEAEPQLSVLDLAIREKLELNHSCEGMGTCGTCRVIVKSDLKNLPEPNEIELEMIQSRNFSPKERLACQLQCSTNLDLEIPED